MENSFIMVIATQTTLNSSHLTLCLSLLSVRSLDSYLRTADYSIFPLYSWSFEAMDYDDALLTRNVTAYMTWLLWCCLSFTPSKLKSPVFAMVIGTQAILQQLLSDSKLVFAPSLLAILQATTPPSISDLMTLPIYVSKCWGVYL